MIRFEDFGKHYGDRVAVESVSFAVEAGEAVALLGPNGSGKTTTLKGGAGLIRPTSGHVWIGAAGREASDPAARQTLSYLPQRVSFPDALTGLEVLEFYRRLRGRRGRPRPGGPAPGLVERRLLPLDRDLLGRAWCSGSAWPWPRFPTPRSCCWTSRRPLSTPMACARSTGWSSAGGAMGGRFSSPPTSWATSNGSRTVSFS